MLHALRRTPLGAEAGLAIWGRAQMLGRMWQALREDQPTLDALAARYKVPYQAIIDRVASIALRWMAQRRLDEDAATAASAPTDRRAETLREALPQFRQIGDLPRTTCSTSARTRRGGT